MLTAAGCLGRRERLWGAVPPGLDLLIVAAPEHLNYFAGYLASPFAFRSNESGALLALEPARAILIADDMQGPYLGKAFADEVAAPPWYDGNRPAPERRGHLIASAMARLAAIPARRNGVERAAVPSGVVEGLRAARPGLEIVDIGPAIRPLRRSKDPDEVACIRRAIRAGEAGHAAALAGVKPGMTELDAYLIVQNAAIADIGEPAIVYGDFVSGPRTETERGGPPTSRRIEAGDLLLLDFSVVHCGYRGDFTNTFAVGRPPKPRQRGLFDACAAALEAGEAALKPGATGREVDAAVRRAFAARGLEHAFLSHSGHGIGLGHPEPPYLVPESDETIQVGDVLALEPGLYIEGEGGMRFERNYLINADGPERLSNHAIRLEP